MIVLNHASFLDWFGRAGVRGLSDLVLHHEGDGGSHLKLSPVGQG